MAPNENSLNSYNKSLFLGTGNTSNNFNRNHEATQKPMDGWRGSTSYNNIWAGAQKYNTTNWCYPYTKDRIAYGSTGTSTAETASKAIGITAAVLGLGVTSFNIYAMAKNLFGKKSKEDASKNFNPDVETSLSDLIRTANSYDDKSTLTDIADTSTSLGRAITTATNQQHNAVRDKSTAEHTKNTLEEKRPALINALQTFDTEKQAIECEISGLKDKLTNPDLTEEQKTAIKKQIETLEESLKKNYPDSKRKELANQVKQNAEGIAEQEKIIAENEQKIKDLDSQIKEANKAKKQLDDKIKKRNDN